MNVTILIENTAPEGSGLDFEAGLALYIEYNGKKILLDGGTSGKFAANADKLGIDLSQVELGVLSHGHFDHADGLCAFFPLNDKVTVLTAPAPATGITAPATTLISSSASAGACGR